MIWYEMSYNLVKNKILDKLNVEAQKQQETEEKNNEFNQTNTFIFDRHKCIL